MADYSNFGEYDELDLNGSIEQESQFVDLPIGDYDGIIDHYEMGVCEWDNPNYNGKKMLSRALKGMGDVIDDVSAALGK